MIEEWMASPCYNSGRAAYNKAVLHLTVGATTIESLGGFFANGANKVSSHHGADNYQRGIFGAYVYEQNSAWTQGNANGYCLSLEQCTPKEGNGWSRDYWLNSQDTLLRNTAEWVAYVCKKYGIPIKALNNSEAQNPNVKGVCQHVQLGSWGGNHSDCGNNFPMDKVIEWAKGGTPPQPSEDQDVTASSTYYQSRQYTAYIDPNGKVCVNGGVVDSGSNARNGVSLAIDPESGQKLVTYTNQAGKVCTYHQNVGDPKWYWTDREWNAR